MQKRITSNFCQFHGNSTRCRSVLPIRLLIYESLNASMRIRIITLSKRVSISYQQCCGSGCIWASRIHIRTVSHKYGSDSGSFHHHAKLIRKTLILLFCDFFLTFYQCSGSASGSVRQRYGSVPKCHGSTTLLIYRSRMAICWLALADRSDQDDDKN